MMTLLLVSIALFLSFGNGANDNFKGFATVWGSDTLSYRQALWLATFATIAGSLLSLFLANGLVQQFSGKGLLPDTLVNAPQFIFSVALAAALTVMIATRAGLPVSTTHALIGGLLGAGLAASANEIQFGKLWNGFMLPLLFSPLVAALSGYLACQGIRRLRQRVARRECACIIAPGIPLEGVSPGTGSIYQHVSIPTLLVASDTACNTLDTPVARVSVTKLLDRLHVLSAGLICFARAVNDTPKLAALLIAAKWLSAPQSILAIAIAMTLGGLLLSRRVAITMSQRVTQMDHTQGVAANLITTSLVLGASQLGLPVSTTHVSVGSIAGVGAGAHSLNWHTLRNILLSWLATLPLAAFIAWLTLTLI